MVSGVSTTEIAKRLRAGTGGLDEPVPITDGTVKHWAKGLRAQRGNPLTWGNEETSEDSTRAIRSALLHCLRVQTNLFQAEAENGEILSAPKVRTAGEIAKTIDDMERRTAVRNGEAARSQQTVSREQNDEKVNVLDRLVTADLEREEARNGDQAL